MPHAVPEGSGGARGRQPGSTELYLCELGEWSSMPLGERSPVPLDVARLSELAAGAPDVPDAVPDAVDPAVVVDPVSPLMLVRRDGVLGIYPPGAAELTPLSPVDLAVLDSLDRAATVADLAVAAGLTTERCAAVTSRLADAGAVRLLPPGSRGENGGTAYPLLALSDAERPRERSHPALAPLDPARIPVISVHQPRYGPPLALGMILASARQWEGGRLNDVYELRQLLTHDEARLLLRDHRGPLVLLCSNYIWSAEANLELAAELAADHPQLVAVHGGPHTPKYEGDVAEFFEHPGVHVTVRGEGEYAAAEVLDALASAERFGDLSPLAGVDGLTFRDPGGDGLVRTPDRDRIHDLDALPSPYLTGEFDDLHPASWKLGLGGVVCHETNRGCPYQCTFCDWGSLTMARIRKFSLERVYAEMQWLADHGVEMWFATDANFGILPRDVDIAERTAQFRRETGFPSYWSVAFAKNSTKNVEKVLETICDAGIAVLASLSLQTRDADTLDAVMRQNIHVDRYDALAGAFRRNRFPMICDLICGLPGSTVESFRSDLQWAIDHEITVRAWLCYVLPNAPMNDPEYKARYALDIDEDHVVVGSSTFTREEYDVMLRLRMAQLVFEHLGLLRHVLRVLQWDHGLEAMEVVERIVRTVRDEPERYPLLTWTLGYLDMVLMPPAGWRPFYDEVLRFLADELGITPTSAILTAIEVQVATMPDRGRAYPSVVELDHDYVAYYRDATASLQVDGKPSGPPRPLHEYGPARFEVLGDPAFVANSFGRMLADRADDKLSGAFWTVTHFETDSLLTRWFAEVRSTPGFVAHRGDGHEPDGSVFAGTIPAADPVVVPEPVEEGPATTVSWPVRLRRRLLPR